MSVLFLTIQNELKNETYIDTYTDFYTDFCTDFYTDFYTDSSHILYTDIELDISGYLFSVRQDTKMDNLFLTQMLSHDLIFRPNIC